MLDGCVNWPPETVERFRREGYWRGETLGGLVRQAARAHPERVALVCGDQRWSYRELDARVDRVAGSLVGRGYRHGDRVVVQLPNSVEFVLVCVALFRIGAIPVLSLPAHRANEVVHLCAHSGAVAYVVAATHGAYDYRELARTVLAASTEVCDVIVVGEPEEFVGFDELDAEPVDPARVDPSDVAFFLLSGGTTGVPKLIPRTHDDYAYNVRACVAASGMTEESVQLVVLPMGHNGALGCPGVLGSLISGGTAVLSSDPSPDSAFALIESERVTLATLVPPLVSLWTDDAAFGEHDLSSLGLLQVGGAKLAREVALRIRPALGCRLQQWFGLAEGPLCHTRLDDPEEVVLVSQGRPLSPADEIRVVDEDENPVPDGAEGQLVARGPTTFQGYYRASTQNAELFTADGFLRTGDVVRLLPEGHISVEGRITDLVNRGGEKVAAEEIENHLLAHPGVSRVAIVGIPDDLLGEITCAMIVARGEAPALTEIAEFLDERGVARYKIPDRVEVLVELPRTPVGKVSKAALRTIATERRAARAA